MWDNIAPLKLLESMPENLEDDHLAKLQMLLEADRYKHQIINGFDLCGTYAPICDGCDKGVKYPCATAYLNYLKRQAEAKEVASEIPAEDSVNGEEEIAEPSPEVDNVDNEVENVANIREQPLPVEEAEEEVDEVKVDEVPTEVEPEQPKTRIRIAVARKRTI